MITNHSDYKKYIKEDRIRNFRGKEYSMFKYFLGLLFNHEQVVACEYLRCLRKLEYTINCKEGLLKMIFYHYYRYRLHKKSMKYHILIGPNMVGYGLRLTHFMQGGIIINCKKMGNYCSANAGVIIGNKDSQENVAIIGDNVSFSVGSKVIGKINIGDNSIVAPNSVVIKDVPAGAVVSGVPAVIIKKKY